MTPSFILLLAFLISAGNCRAKNTMANTCPSPESIAPKCVCKEVSSFGPVMHCSQIMNTEELSVIVKAAMFHSMYLLTIHDSSLMYLPDDIFKQTNFKLIRFERTELMSLAENDLAFEGLEDSLEKFSVLYGRFVAKWSWSELRNLRKLQEFDADLVTLDSISEPFPPLNLKSLSLTRASISYIVPNAFQELEHLENLELTVNEISEIDRDMFPYPATNLEILDLSHNKLSILPGDIFHEMPRLKHLILAFNEITTLNEEVYSPVGRFLIELSLQGNSIRCDCRLRWIVKAIKAKDFKAVCSQPENLKGVDVKSLQINALWC